MCCYFDSPNTLKQGNSRIYKSLFISKDKNTYRSIKCNEETSQNAEYRKMSNDENVNTPLSKRCLTLSFSVNLRQKIYPSNFETRSDYIILGP